MASMVLNGLLSKRSNGFDDITVSKLIAEENNQYMQKHTRDEKEIKQYSKRDMIFSKFNQMASKIKNFFTRDKVKEENTENVDREQ